MKTNQGVANILVILVGLVLVAVVVGFFSSKGSFKLPEANAPQTPETKIYPTGGTALGKPVAEPDTGNYICGLWINNLSPGQTLRSGYEILGYVNGCGWRAFGREAGTVQVFNSRSQALSAPIALYVPQVWTTIPVNFKAKLTFTSSLTPEGYLLFRNAELAGDKSQTFQVPIRF